MAAVADLENRLVSGSSRLPFFDIAAFVCGSPEELGVLARTAKTVAVELEPASGALWNNMYKSRWPAFHGFLDHQGPQQWEGLYQDTLAGKTEVLLEVFDREKKPGFAMAAMPARVTFDAGRGSYVASYISAKEIPLEHIPEKEGQRLRCCPPAVRDALQVRPLPGSDPGLYMDRVLPGFEGLRPGVEVELQWRMQEGSPFGWWYVHLDALEYDEGGALATATLTFRHFPRNSRLQAAGALRRRADAALQVWRFHGRHPVYHRSRAEALDGFFSSAQGCAVSWQAGGCGTRPASPSHRRQRVEARHGMLRSVWPA